jgi:6-methylsalicylate decarboxylase
MSACTRRHFLAAAASAAAFAQTPPRAVNGWIDVHHHVLPDFWKQATSIPNNWSLEGSLAAMEANGVATSILSFTGPGPWLGLDKVAASRDLARRCNDFLARLAVDHPGRFGFFAALPLPDAEGALKEIEYAFDTLKADGAGLLSSYTDNKWLGEVGYAPVLAELNRRRATVYVHPYTPACCGNLMPNVRPQVLEWPHDTTRTVVNLLSSGAFAKFRDINWIFSHGGGTLPSLAGRIAQMMANQPDVKAAASQGVEAELRRLHFELANAANPASMAALMKVVPLANILFGTDYPFVPVEVTANGLKAAGLSAAELAQVSRGNAQRLLARWR